VEEVRRLVEHAVGGHNGRILAPRRYGKTSLLRRVLADAEIAGAIPVYVDLFGVLTAADVARRIDQAYAADLEGSVGRWVRDLLRTLRPVVRLGGGPVPASIELSGGIDQGTLLDRLALPRRVHERTGRRVVVAFDEFPDLLRAGDHLDAVMRSEIQHHGQAAGYLFAGSDVGMMRELFASKRRAFYGQASPTALGPLSPIDVGEYVAERFERTGRDAGRAVGALLDIALGHPQRSMLLAHALWERTEPGTVATPEDAVAALDFVMRSEVADEFTAVWTRLPAGQQRVLTAIAENAGPLHGRAVADRTGAKRGGATQGALRALVDAGEVVPAPEQPTGHRVVDPLLGRWVAAGRTWPPRD